VTHHPPDLVGGVDALRATGAPTLPPHIAQERTINPFLGCDAPEAGAAARHHGAPDDCAVAVFATLRQWKNDFR
jgi:hydroxyacylglutathione hydrolase